MQELQEVPDTSNYKWQFQLDDSKSLHIGNGWKSETINFLPPFEDKG